MAEQKVFGERVHPATGRTMIYVACDVIEGDARVVDDEELVDFTWSYRDELAKYVPYVFFPAVQDYVDATLSALTTSIRPLPHNARISRPRSGMPPTHEY